MANILKTASIIGIFATSLLIILWILGIATTKEFQDILLKSIGVIGILTAAGIGTMFVLSLGSKKID